VMKLGRSPEVDSFTTEMKGESLGSGSIILGNGYSIEVFKGTVTSIKTESKVGGVFLIATVNIA
jgi:hypothetical protein